MALETLNGTYIFFSYAQRDKALRDQLENHLSNLKYRGLITTWHDQEIRAGEERTRQLDIYLNNARIILLLISAHFMASEYCYGLEMQRALERHQRGEAHVIPVLLRPVLFTNAPFAGLQMLPKNGKPVVKWSDRDSAFVDIACEIEKIALTYKVKVVQKGKKCPYCGAETRPGDIYCLNCGNPLLPAAPYYSAPQQRQPGNATMASPTDWASSVPVEMPQAKEWGYMVEETTEGTENAAELATQKADYPASMSQTTIDRIEPGARFILRSDDGEVVQEYPLDKAEIRIGRAPDSDILLSKDKLTSRRHATVRYENNQYILQDERSANGTFINRQQIEEMVPQVLHDGDHIGIGEHELIFRAYDSPSDNIESLNTVAVPFNVVPQENTFRTRQDDNATLATSQGDDFCTQEAPEDQVPATPEPEVQPQQPAIASQPESIPAAPAITSYAYEPAPQSEPVASPPVPSYEKAEPAESPVLGEQDLEAIQKRQYYKDALKAYEDAIMRDPYDSAAYLGIGNACYAMQRYAAALNAFQQAIRLHPTATAWAGRGNVFAELYLYQQAVEAYEKALQLDTTVTLDYDALVQALMALGRVQEAERYRERARELGYYDEG